MKKEFHEYLESIGITEGPILKRVEEIYNVAIELLNEEPEDIFIDEYITEEGTRKYEDIDFFYKKKIFCGINFISKDEFNIESFFKNIYYLKISKKNYDFKNANAKSRMFMHFIPVHIRLRGNFKASGENCNQLKKIYFKYFITNIVE